LPKISRLKVGALALSQNAVVHINQNRGSTGFRNLYSTFESLSIHRPAWILKRSSIEKRCPSPGKAIEI
jgi:hypothetical protein